MKVKLTEPEKILIQRYIDAEKEVEGFLSVKGMAENFKREVFIFVYLAGHGCADT